MTPANVTTLLLGLAGLTAGLRGGQKAERAETKVVQVERAASSSRGRLRATVDSLRLELAAEKDERRREARTFQRQLARLQSRPAVAPKFRTATETGDQGDADEDADDEANGPVGPPAPAQGLGKRLLKGLGKLFGG